jgi:ABC-type antimicrobial peptide transport system permease subunit
VLRALGTTPRQILSVLLWEYGIVYLTSLALGFLFGWLLSSAALPALVFADALDNSSNVGPTFNVPPTRLILPGGELAAVLGGLVLLCALAVAAMTYLLSRSSLSATLRLNQD